MTAPARTVSSPMDPGPAEGPKRARAEIDNENDFQ